MANPFGLLVAYWGDPLKNKSPQEIAGFYRRLAGLIEGMVGAGNSNAAKFLRWWLEKKGKPLAVDSAAIRDVPHVKDYLAKQVRPVFLTEKKVAHTGKLGGIVPRLMKKPPFGAFVQKDSSGNFLMEYEGPPVSTISQFEFGSIMKKYRDTKNITDQEKRYLDIFTSFHKFGIESKVAVSAKQSVLSKYRITFASWTCEGFDTYNWNYDLGFPVPNPDHGSQASGAIAPDEPIVVVRHKHAKRVKDAGLAHDYPIKTTTWKPVDKKIIGPATVDLARF